MRRLRCGGFPGLTIETVSRVVTKLERENVIRVVPEGLQLLGSTERPLLFERSYKIAQRAGLGDACVAPSWCPLSEPRPSRNRTGEARACLAIAPDFNLLVMTEVKSGPASIMP